MRAYVGLENGCSSHHPLPSALPFRHRHLFPNMDPLVPGATGSSGKKLQPWPHSARSMSSVVPHPAHTSRATKEKHNVIVLHLCLQKKVPRLPLSPPGTQFLDVPPLLLGAFYCLFFLPRMPFSPPLIPTFHPSLCKAQPSLATMVSPDSVAQSIHHSLALSRLNGLRAGHMAQPHPITVLQCSRPVKGLCPTGLTGEGSCSAMTQVGIYAGYTWGVHTSPGYILGTH